MLLFLLMNGKIFLKILLILACIAGGLFFVLRNRPIVVEKEVIQDQEKEQEKEIIKEVVSGYYLYTISETETLAKLKKEIEKDGSDENFKKVLALNRLDQKFIGMGLKLVVPQNFPEHEFAFSAFPGSLSILNNVPKIVLISQKNQAFAVYQAGQLIRTGPVSTGKKSTQTPNGLFTANWKAKTTNSTIDGSWVLPWYVNLDNFEGISMHQYELPGHPASHSCIRMYENDARFIHDFVDQWNLSSDGASIIKHGTPVLIFGDYEYDKVRPWLNLVTEPNYLNMSEADLTKVLEPHMQNILGFVQEMI